MTETNLGPDSPTANEIADGERVNAWLRQKRQEGGGTNLDELVAWKIRTAYFARGEVDFVDTFPFDRSEVWLAMARAAIDEIRKSDDH
jgi:hypothetical protein